MTPQVACPRYARSWPSRNSIDIRGFVTRAASRRSIWRQGPIKSPVQSFACQRSAILARVRPPIRPTSQPRSINPQCRLWIVQPRPRQPASKRSRDAVASIASDNDVERSVATLPHRTEPERGSAFDAPARPLQRMKSSSPRRSIRAPEKIATLTTARPRPAPAPARNSHESADERSPTRSAVASPRRVANC